MFPRSEQSDADAKHVIFKAAVYHVMNLACSDLTRLVEFLLLGGISGAQAGQLLVLQQDIISSVTLNRFSPTP